MKHNLKPGDKVRFLNEVGTATISNITSQYIYVINEDGFEISVSASDIISVDDDNKKVVENAPPVQNYEVKKEDIIIEKFAHNEEIEEPGSTNQKPLKTDFPKGVYIAFAPVNQDILITGDVQVYVINYTPMSLILSCYSSEKNGFENIFIEEIEAASAQIIETVAHEELKKYFIAVVQIMFTTVSKNGLAKPMNIGITIKSSRFLKESNFIDNDIVGCKAVTVNLFELAMVDFVENESSFFKYGISSPEPLEATISNNNSLISKYKTGNLEAEIDLHIEKITDDCQNIEDSKKLNIQLDFFNRCLQSAIDEEYKKVVFIHGVGVGILKIELYKILKNYEFIEYRDAPISKYGIGATEVLISL